ncbi:MAG: tRNA (adenosine(37)-N6)-threonylcarbamoyltransferase complex dimerization subunit type 1 TsaB [Cardiobacteriaceae bacterium]|nr:tRNA (adenosine(37)-N6)-threonylcarbamoyltransferase complex dimerization subunit type 1 TsaB [Cardiobacteriaceae bacterium]
MELNFNQPLLALDTSTQNASCALQIDGNKIISRFFRPDNGAKHTEVLLYLIDEMLKEAAIDIADLEAVIVGIGPGGFTGLRVAAAAASALAIAGDLPLGVVSSLALLAAEKISAAENQIILPCLDARMSEIYCGQYQVCNGELRQIAADKLLNQQDFEELANTKNALILGSATVYLSQDFLSDKAEFIFPELLPNAEKAFSLLNLVSWQTCRESVLLNYLRNEVADKPKR